MTQSTPPLSAADSDLLSAYIDQQLSASEQAALERRLQQEPELRLALDELRATVEVLHALPPVSPPRSFTLPAHAPAPRVWLSLGVLRFGSAFASVLFVLTFVPALLRVGSSLPSSGGAPIAASAPTAAVAYEAVVAPTFLAEPVAGLEMLPQAAGTPVAAPAAAQEPAGSMAAATEQADASAENGQARLLEATTDARPLLDGGTALQQEPPPVGNASDTGGSLISPPIATSGSSSPGTAVLVPPTAVPEPVDRAPDEPLITALNLLRLALAAVALGCAFAFWRRRQQEPW